MISDVDLVSPLHHLEAAVQRRAKEAQIDLHSTAGCTRLRQFITEEIEIWEDETRQGLRQIEISAPIELAERIYRNIAAYGPLTSLLEDDDVWEIMINGFDAIFVKRHAGESGYHHDVFYDTEHLRRTLTKLLDDASSSHRKFDPAEGLQDAQLTSGARVHIVHSDIARDGNLVPIRIKATQKRFTIFGIGNVQQPVDVFGNIPDIRIRGCRPFLLRYLQIDTLCTDFDTLEPDRCDIRGGHWYVDRGRIHDRCIVPYHTVDLDDRRYDEVMPAYDKRKRCATYLDRCRANPGNFHYQWNRCRPGAGFTATAATNHHRYHDQRCQKHSKVLHSLPPFALARFILR